MHPASPQGASPVAGMKPRLARLEMTLRLECKGGMLCTLTQSAEPPGVRDPVRTVVWEGSREASPIPNKTRNLTTSLPSGIIKLMGLVHTDITLKNPRHPELRPVETHALV